MKFFSVLILFFNICIYSQVDDNGNPIFNSIPIDEISFDDYTLSSNYYTITNNVDNPNSSVFINENPSTNEITEFVRTKPSYFFIIQKNQIVSHMIMLFSRIEGKKSKYSFFVMNPNSKKSIEIPCHVTGDVTELRAAELLKEYKDDSQELKFGPKSMIVYGEVAYSIQPFEEVKSELIKLIDQYQLYKSDIDLDELE